MGSFTNKKDLSIGWIPYWNLAPLKSEILSHMSSIRFTGGSPVQINDWLLQGKVDLAPCSSVCLFKYPEFEMSVPCGVAVTGSVKSVYWGFYQEQQEFVSFIKEQTVRLKEIVVSSQTKYPSDVRRQVKYICSQADSLPSCASEKIPVFEFTKASATSSALTKVLLNLLLGKKSYQRMLIKKNINSVTKPAQLLIGNEALLRKNEFIATIDLGELWYDLTANPFVYAVWQSKGAVLNGWRRFLIEMSSIAEKKISVSPTDYFSTIVPCDQRGKEIDLLSYWKNIRYCLQEKDFQGLILFLCLLKEVEDKFLAQDWLKKIHRWQNKCSSQDLYSF
jgi:predicted solute-binding protein